MGSYHRITIAFFLIVCMVGFSAAACRGDGTVCSSSMAPSTSPSTPQRVTTSDSETYTVIGTTIITMTERSNKDSSQVTNAPTTPTTLTSAPESTNGVDVTTGPVSQDLEEKWTTLANEILTSNLAVIMEDIADVTATDELQPTTQDADVVSSPFEYVDITTVPTQEIAPNDITTASDMVTTALSTTPGQQSTAQFASTSETLTTSDHITPAPLTTPERATTSMIHTTLPITPERTTTPVIHTTLPITPERATTSMIHTTLPITPERATTSVIHTTLPLTPERAPTPVIHTTLPITPERATTPVIHTSLPATTESQASTQSVSASHDVQTISASELSSEDLENIVTLHFRGITEDAWLKSYDVFFRGYLSNTLTTDTMKVRPEDIYYIEPTPIEHSNILYVSFIAKSSSGRKRSTMPVVPLNETLGALSNLTALTQALGIPLSQAPTISTELPDFIQDTLPAETTHEPLTTDTTHEPLTTDTTQEALTTRKTPPTIGFLSNPGLFISLVVIATVSIIIIIVGLIYLLCDRRRGRSGEYITNHTPRNSDLELGLDNPVMAEHDKAVSNGNHLSSIKGDMESDMIVPYDNFTQEELMNYEVEDTHL